MKKLLSIISSLVMTLAFAGVVLAYNTTVGNDPILRPSTDTRADFVVVDTNNPADHEGLLERFEYYATTDKSFHFIVVDGGFVVQWVSEEITPLVIGGVNEFEPTNKAPVEAGWNVGLYYPETGTIPYAYTGDDRAYFTNAGWGLPVVGEPLIFQNLIQNRTYSYVGYYDPDLDDDGVLNEDDLCPDTVIDQPYGGIGTNRWYWNGEMWGSALPKGQQAGELSRNKQYSMVDVYGCSCTQILDKITDLSESDMEGHYRFGCSSSVLDEFIADLNDGEFDGYDKTNPFQSFFVPATLTEGEYSGVYSNVLEEGRDYLVRASGTYRFVGWTGFDPIYSQPFGLADAEYSNRISAYGLGGVAGWTLGEGFFASECGLDLQVNSCVDWGSFNPDHEYEYTHIGDGLSAYFWIYDNVYTDNSDGLDVDIYEYLY